MTAKEQRPASSVRPPRRGKPEPPATPPADQGDLWSDHGASVTPPPVETSPFEPTAETPPVGEPEPAAPDLDAFIADLPPEDVADGQVAAPAPVRAPGARRAGAATSLAARPDTYVQEEYEPAAYYEETEYSMLRNPYVLAGLAVAVAIVAAVFVVIVFGSGGDGGDLNSGITSPGQTPQPGEVAGLKARSIAIAAVREGPGREHSEIGLLRSGQDVSVVGRNAESSWYEIIYPASDLQGWVPATALRLPDNAASLISVVNFTPIPKPSVAQPTATLAPAATPTENAQGAPDLELATLGGQCQSGTPITLSLRNVGSLPINGRLVNVIVSRQGNVTQNSMTITLGPGQAMPLATGQNAQPPQTSVSVVFVSAPQDSNPSNNVVVCNVAGGGSGGGPGPGGGTAIPPPINNNNDDD